MDNYVKFRCPNRPIQDSDFECRSSLGGVSISVISTHDYTKPWKDIRRCEKCGYVEITISDRGAAPEYRMVGKDEKIGWVVDNDFFGLIYAHGRRITK